jgi:hypothetical protein
VVLLDGSGELLSHSVHRRHPTLVSLVIRSSRFELRVEQSLSGLEVVGRPAIRISEESIKRGVVLAVRHLPSLAHRPLLLPGVQRRRPAELEIGSGTA